MLYEAYTSKALPHSALLSNPLKSGKKHAPFILSKHLSA
ncbi:Uncharacterised protein [Neisseria zoodegmatis]|uniref:Uncharacterized protein n=1 Tax=Neisseria zoodegmatis TaxID=326523 RepID=A0AB38DQ90_9NEIS|nr:Uncharacterised protein [Neisseria zoodegmatis]